MKMQTVSAKQPEAQNRPKANLADLGRFALFDGFSPTELSSLLPFLQRRILKKGVTVIEQGKTDSGLFLLHKGSVKVCLQGDGGQETIVATCVPGDVLGEADAADGRGHSASVITLEDSHFLWLSPADFKSCQARFPRINENLARMLAGRLRAATASQQAQIELDLPGRIAYQLLKLAERHGATEKTGPSVITLNVSQRTLAAQVGSKRECINRVLGHFKEQDCLSITGDGTITIHNVSVLQEYCRRNTESELKQSDDAA